MKRTIIICDRCQDEDAKASTIALPVRDEPDQAGGRSTPTCESVDLCPACLEALIYRLTKHNTYDQNQDILDALRKGKLP